VERLQATGTIRHMGMPVAFGRPLIPGIWMRRVLPLAVAFGLGHAGFAQGASLGWSPEVPPGSTGGSAVRADAVACPAATQCTAVDSQGQEATFNPRLQGSVEPNKIDWGNKLAGIACPSISQCTAVDNRGGQFTFDPAAPGTVNAWQASSVSLFAVACASEIECVGVGNPQSTAVTFDPVGLPSAITLPIEEVDGLGAVSCPSARQCTATTLESEVTFDPAAPSAAAPVPIGSEGWIPAIACPTLTQCTAVESGGQQITFDPSSPTGAEASPIGISAPWGVACPSTEQCTAVGEFQTSTFDPLEPGGLPLVGGAGGGFASAIACPELTQCTIVAGDQETTFDPQALPTPSPTEIGQTSGPTELPSASSPTETPPKPGSSAARSRISLLPGSTVSVTRGRAVVAVDCLGDASCSIELALGSGHPPASAARAFGPPVAIGWARRTIAAGTHARVGIALTRAGGRLLHAHRGRMAAQLVVNGRGGSALIHATTSVRLRLAAHA